MFYKLRAEPERIKQNKMLIIRLAKGHEKLDIIHEDLAKRSAGYRGELKVDYFLSFLPSDKHYIFCDIRLIQNDKPFQIDTLVITSSFILILETKNILGTLFFDKHSNQLIRTLNGEDEGFSNPMYQVEHQKRQLKEWMKKYNFPLIPIEHLVIISSPSTIIKTTNGNHVLFNKVLHAEHLLNKINELEQTFKKHQLDKKMIRKLNKLLLKNHTPREENILEWYGLHHKEIITGVQCPKCGKLPMARMYGTWYCRHCHEKNKSAHKQAINDYFLIYKTINNQQCREFLHLESRYTSKKILKSMNLPYTGNQKSRIYFKPTN